MSTVPSSSQTVPTLFQSGPCMPLHQEVYDLIETAEPVEHTVDYISTLVMMASDSKLKQHSYKIPHPSTPVPSWLQQSRKQLHNAMVDTFFKIHKKRRAVNCLEEHREGLTFPPEYSSLKMPQLSQDTTTLGEELNAYAANIVHEAKKTILDKHIETDSKLLNGYKFIMSKIVAETYKSLAQKAFRNTFHSEFNDWPSLTHILADHTIIHKLCSQDIHKRLASETLKRQQVQAAQALAVQQESTISIKDLVTKTDQQQIRSQKTKPHKINSTKSSKNNPSFKNPEPKKNDKKKDKPRDPLQPPDKTKQKASKQNGKAKKLNKGHLKGSQSKVPSSTSSRLQKGGNN